MTGYRDLLAAVKAHRLFLLILSFAAILFLTNIGGYRQLLRAESNFALGARTMLETNEFLLPHAPHELPLNKPPVQYWLIGAAYGMLGIGHGASRVPAALCGLGVLTLVYLLGRRLYGERVGAAAAAMLGTSYMFWSFARLAMPDMLLTLCVSASLVCWTLVLADRTRRPGTLALAGYAALAVGFLTKGPVAGVLTVAPVLLGIRSAHDLVGLKRLRPLAGTLVFLVLTVPYFLLVYASYGIEPLHNFFLRENLERFTGTTAYDSSKLSPVYEVTAFLADFAPWSPLLLVAACAYARLRNTDEPGRLSLRLLFMWTIWPLLFFSVSRFKLDYYMLPAVPPAALLLAYGLLRQEPLSPWARRAWLAVLTAGGLALVSAMGVTALVVEVNFSDVGLRWMPHGVAVLSLLPVVWSIRRKTTYGTVLTLCFSLWATALSAYVIFIPGYARFQPAADLAASVPPGAHVYASWKAEEWMWDLALYLPASQPVRTLAGDSDNVRLTDVFRTDEKAVALVYRPDYVALSESGARVRVLAQGDAYRGNRLTLKALLHPRHETLYLVAP